MRPRSGRRSSAKEREVAWRDDPKTVETAPRREKAVSRVSKELCGLIDNPQNIARVHREQDARIRAAAALASVDGRMSPRAWAEGLADMIGFILGSDESVPNDRIDEIAASIGRVIAAVAHAEREQREDSPSTANM